MKKHTIYEFISPSGKRYIGRTKNSFKQRMNEHYYRYNTVEVRWKLYDALKKYGWENFEKNIIEKVDTVEKAIKREFYYIKKYDTVENGYNMTDVTDYGGDNMTYIKENEPDRWKELQKKFSNKGEENGMFGKFHKKSSINEMKKKAKGRFSLPWYIDKYGKEEGTEKYNERCKSLSERNLKRDKNGRYI